MAPHPALMSLALYSVPSLQDELSHLGYKPGAQGYANLRSKLGNGTNAPTVRTIQKMLHDGELAKWSICDGIIQLLNVARKEQELPLLGPDAIAGYEWYIDDLWRTFGRIRTKFGVSADAARAAIAEECGCRVELVRVLGKKRRTTREQCDKVRDAVLKLYGLKVEVLNRPHAVQSDPKRKPTRGRRQKTAKPVPERLR